MARADPGDLLSAIEEARRDRGMNLGRISIGIGGADGATIRSVVKPAVEQGKVIDIAARVRAPRRRELRSGDRSRLRGRG